VSLKKHLTTIKTHAQFVLFSATYSEDILERAQTYVGDLTVFSMQPDALRLKGVQTLRITLSEAEKITFVADMFQYMSKTMSMIFVNKKKSALVLKEKLRELNLEAKILIGGMETAERDEVID
jgi:ATP-dependent RNA helicase RhlB